MCQLACLTFGFVALVFLIAWLCGGAGGPTAPCPTPTATTVCPTAAPSPTAAPVPSPCPSTAPSPSPAPPTATPGGLDPLPPTGDGPILEEYAGLYAQNSDLAGWLRVEGADIDLPVMYTPADPEHYLYRNFEGQPAQSGLPFIGIGSAPTPPTTNIYIFGHHLRDQSGFTRLLRYADPAFWAQWPVFTFDTLHERQTFEVYAAFYAQVLHTGEEGFRFYSLVQAQGQADFDAYVQGMLQSALYDTGVRPRYGDQLLTLVTCAYQAPNGRFVVAARRAVPQASVQKAKKRPAVASQTTNSTAASSAARPY